MTDVYYRATIVEDNDAIQHALEQQGFRPMSAKGLPWLTVDVQFVISLTSTQRK